MSALTDQMVATAKAAGTAQLEVLVERGKQDFLSVFGSFVNPGDVARLEVLFVKAFTAKKAQFLAASAGEATEQGDIYDASMDEIEVIGDDYELVGEAKAGKFIRLLAHQIIAGFFAVGGALLQVGLGMLFPVVGTYAGAGLNAGLQHVVAHFNQ